MKKNVFYYFFAALFAVTMFASCSDDDDVASVLPIDEEIAGNYGGKLDIAIDDLTISGDGVAQNVTVTKAGDAAISLSIADFSFATINVGDINLNNCPLTSTGENSYSFTAESFELTSEDGTLTCTVTLNSGTIVNGTLTLGLSINADLGGAQQNVSVTFTGVRGQTVVTESSEAAITSFSFDSSVAEVNAGVISEPVIDESAKTITFNVSDIADVTALVPTIVVSEGATVSPASGTAQDFSSPVTYTVTAADGETTAAYTVSISNRLLVYNFEDWEAGVEGQEPDMTFYNPVGWSSSNTGAHFLKGMSLTDSYVVMETDDAHSGSKAALIKSIDTVGKDLWIAKAPKVTTGSLFLGNFITDITSTLNSTKFGIPYSNKPVLVRGWYKYTPGSDYYIVNETPYADHCHEAVLDATKTDEFIIGAVLYETSEYDTEEWSDCLTGVADAENNIYTSSRIAAIAQLTGGAQSEWKEFNLELEWKKEYNADTKYRFAIICSSSKDGDKFWGAPESTLIVDDIEVVVE